MKFAHIADCHIGSWRDPKLNDISTRAFSKVIDMCIKEKVDFVVLAGDLFNTPLPAIDRLKSTVVKLKELNDAGIPLYGIGGSHDFSPSGKSMIDVLEGAGLFKNVCVGEDHDGKLRLKFITDKTGVKITGLLGKKGMLDKKYYEVLDLKSLEEEPGKKIFLFHTLLTELKPKNLQKMDSQELSLLPKGFDYYAGGHPHIIVDKRIDGYGVICYTGPLFPNSFYELSEFGHGGFYIVEDFVPKFIPIRLYETFHIEIDAQHKTPKQITEEILEKEQDFSNTIITLRVTGCLESGKPREIEFKEIFEKFYSKGAYFIMKNTNALTSKEFEEIKVDIHTPEEIEQKLINEHAGQWKERDIEKKMIKELMEVLSFTKKEGEKVADYNNRLLKDLNAIFEMENDS